MLLQFCLAFLAGVFILLIPGLCVLRPLGLTTLTSVACSPLVSICILIISGTICSALGMLGVTPLVVLATILCAFLTIYTVAASKGTPEINAATRKITLHTLAILVLYSAVGLAVIYHVFLQHMNGLDSFVQYDDNATHLGLISSMHGC